MRSYVTLEGQVLDLSQLSEAERAFMVRCVEAYRQGTAWLALGALIDGTENPLIRATGGWITREVWAHPLYRAARDLEDRLGIQQGELAADPEDDLKSDSFAVADKPASVGLA